MRRLLLAFAALACLLVLAAPAGRAAAADPLTDPICLHGSAAVRASAYCSANPRGGDPVAGKNGILIKATRIISLVTGISAVIVIIVGGYMYIFSAGDPGKAQTARNAIIYAAVGLIVVVVGRAVIIFIINTYG